MQADGVIGKYAIGGAVGATFYLEPSATADVDIFVMLPTAPGSSPLSVSPIYEYLRARGCRIEGERIVVGDWPVQFLPPHGALEQEALGDAVEAEVEGIRTWVLSAEHLVAIALQTGRTKDHARIVQFLEQGAVDADKLNGVLQEAWTGLPMGEVQAQVSAGVAMDDKEGRKRLAALPFSEKLKILEKLRDRSRAIAASGLRKTVRQEREQSPSDAKSKP